jgi:HEXXH motif-containing protein
MLIARHRVPASTFAMLARGHADHEAMSLLRAGQLSKHMLLVRAILDAAAPHHGAAATAWLSDAVELLDEAQRQNPAAAADFLGYPLVGAWAAHCLRRLRCPPASAVPLWVDLAHLAAIAAATAIQAGVEAKIEVPLRGGTVTLPMLGRARLESGPQWGVATIRGRDGVYTVEGPHGSVQLPSEPARERPGWEPVRRFTVPIGHKHLTVYFDDVDPYRDCHGLSATDRLDASSAAMWQSTLADAWALLVRHHPERAEELAADPITVVPLVGLTGSSHLNVTARDSAGAMALTPPPNPVALALSLVHELQHTKLGALLDLVELYDPAEDRRFYSPWRSDPRPLGGLLQGAYAFLAVGMFWRRHATQPAGVVPLRVAQYEVTRAGAQVRAALFELLRSGALTEPGTRFASGLKAVAETSLTVPVPEDVAELAQVVLDDHRYSWRLRNVRMEPGVIEVLADAWLRSKPRPAGEPSSSLATDSVPGYAEEPRHELVRHAVQDPKIRVGGADAALIAGDYASAACGYLAGIRIEPERVDLWSGLAVARSRLGQEPAARVYRTHPEQVFALHQRLRESGKHLDPEALASWLAG